MLQDCFQAADYVKLSYFGQNIIKWPEGERKILFGIKKLGKCFK